jgi:hypothetical protein
VPERRPAAEPEPEPTESRPHHHTIPSPSATARSCTPAGGRRSTGSCNDAGQAREASCDTTRTFSVSDAVDLTPPQPTWALPTAAGVSDFGDPLSYKPNPIFSHVAPQQHRRRLPATQQTPRSNRFDWVGPYRRRRGSFRPAWRRSLSHDIKRKLQLLFGRPYLKAKGSLAILEGRVLGIIFRIWSKIADLSNAAI